MDAENDGRRQAQNHLEVSQNRGTVKIFWYKHLSSCTSHEKIYAQIIPWKSTVKKRNHPLEVSDSRLKRKQLGVSLS